MKLTREQLLLALKNAHDEMWGENMSCPWCAMGHIPETDYNPHDDYCIWLEIEKELSVTVLPEYLTDAYRS